MDNSQKILILGIGNILFSDEGIGIRVIERLRERFQFPDNITILDGGVLGLSLMSYIAEHDYLIVVDAIRNKGVPGTIYRLEEDEIPKRFLVKNSLHQVDFLETLLSCEVIDKLPQTVIIGIEPLDIETLSLEPTDPIKEKIDEIINLILKELESLGIKYLPIGDGHVSCNTC